MTVKRHTLMAHQSFPDLPAEVVAASDYDALAADFLALKEYCAALESREVCTVAHEDVETCGYCQRDALSKDAERYHRVMQIIRALCAAKTPELLADFDAAMGEKP